MKTKFTLLLLCFFALATVKAQYPYDSYRFATYFGNDYSFIEFDPPENNIWQVGTPSKIILDSAYVGSLALMTDTANLISEPIEHSFIIKGHRDPISSSTMHWLFSIKTKYQFDDLYSGGYFEVSYDEGLTWTNIVLDDTLYNVSTNHFYDHRDTLANGVNGFSGTKGEFKHLQIYVDFPCYYTSAALIQSVWLKATYINIREDNPHEGWLIDDIYFNIDNCEWLEHETSALDNERNNLIEIWPNPVQNLLTLKALFNHNEKCEITIYNAAGKKVLQNRSIAIHEPINVSHIPPGVYVCTLQSNKCIHRAKFIKE